MTRRTVDRAKQTSKKKDLFIAGIAKGLTVTAACESAGVGRSFPYDHAEKCQDFADAWSSAEESGTDRLEQALYNKALSMEDAPSVTAAIFMLKGRKPYLYGDKISVDQRTTATITNEPETEEDWEERVTSDMATTGGAAKVTH